MGNYSRWDLWKKMGPHLFHFAHHIGFTSSAAHETSAVNAELSLMFTASGKSGDRPPTIAVRSHRHMCCEVRFPDEKYYTGAFCTPAWQLRTPFSFRVARGRCYMPQVGGALIRLGDEELHTRFFIRNVKRDKPE